MKETGILGLSGDGRPAWVQACRFAPHFTCLVVHTAVWLPAWKDVRLAILPRHLGGSEVTCGGGRRAVAQAVGHCQTGIAGRCPTACL